MRKKKQNIYGLGELERKIKEKMKIQCIKMTCLNLSPVTIPLLRYGRPAALHSERNGFACATDVHVIKT